MLAPGAEYRHATYAKENNKVKSILDLNNESMVRKSLSKAAKIQ